VGEKTSVSGIIIDVEFSQPRFGLGLATATLQDISGRLRCIWFKSTNPRYDVFATLRQRLQEGQSLMVFGAVEIGPQGKQMQVEEMAIVQGAEGILASEDRWHLDRVTPLYTVPEGLSERFLRSLVAAVLPMIPTLASPILPAWLEKDRQLPTKSWALEKIHFPNSFLEKERAREYLAFEEFFILETALGMVRRSVKQQAKHHRYQLHRTLLTPFREHLGFSFTGAQKRVIREIFDDLMSPVPMNRLLQGDVGSGKTVVALSSMLLAAENGGQAALMAPTEILAEQHALTFQHFLKGLRLRWALLTSRQTIAQRKKILTDLAKGQIDLLIGTHALIEKSVQFRQLMLAVIDEQHRFGVEHRALLRQKGGAPDVLVMTATPIPRTLALTVYGDLDVSILDELPPGRAPISTRHVSENEAYQTALEEIRRGHQAYLVFPLVEESNKIELKAVVQEAASLRETVFCGVRVGVLHGQMPSSEKEAVMTQFREGRIDLLMASTVIEVGIDVPNATLMVIQHAERFGLATLHQLRGRVGRGSQPSACLLIADFKNAEARRRIEIMTQTQDGFRISEEDLSLRGPGEVMGVMQHGLPIFKVGHLIRDAHLLQQSRHASTELLQRDPSLSAAAHTPLRQILQRQYGNKWVFGRTG
jgi:ATP-dependent DNA helicase RecG